MKYRNYKYACSVIVGTLLIYQAWIIYLTNYSMAGKNSELISQVHTTEAFESLILEIRNEAKNQSTPNYLLASEGTGWPTNWFFSRTKGYKFTNSDKDAFKLFNHVLILIDPSKPSLREDLNLTHTGKVIALRHWWVPDLKRLNFKHFFNYVFFHKPWNSPGQQNIMYYQKKSSMIKKFKGSL